MEPGRILAADAGWYAAEVADLKQTQGRWFALVRGGTHHFRLPAAWGYSHPFTVLPVDEWPYAWPRPEVAGVARAMPIIPTSTQLALNRREANLLLTCAEALRRAAALCDQVVAGVARGGERAE